MERKTSESRSFIEGRHCVLRFIALLMFLITAVPGAWAADTLFDTPQKAFTWEAKTPGMIHLKLLMSDHGGGRYLKEAIFYVKDASGNKTQFLYANETNSNTSGQVLGQYTYLIDSNDGSCMFMTNGTDGAPKWIINTWQTQHYSLRDGTGPGYMEIDWYWPTKFAGKICTWGVEGRLYGGSTYNKEFGTIEFDEITFETFDPVIGTKDEELGTVTVPFMSEKPINWVEGKYADADGVEHTYRETLPAKTYNGFLRLPASEAHKNLVVTANVTTATWSDAHSGDPTSSTGNVTVTVGDFALIHAPRFFKTTVLDDGNASVQLSWKLDNTDQEEVLDADVFEIQRSLTGKAEDFETIGEEVFDLKQTSYTYKDSLLLSALSQDQVDSVLSIPNVRYRVRRSATSMWGWDRNPTAVFESPRFPSLHLLKAGNLSASWENKDEYKVKLSWTYEASNRDVAYVWDDRATMTLRTVLRNRNKEVVDTLNRVLTREEIFAKQLSLELTRSCVKYEFALVVDAGSSPIGAATGGVFVIADNNNWNSVVERVNNGDTKINIMIKYRPILETDSELLGTEAHPFEGQIDGNGTILYCRFTTNKQAGAPISYAANGAVIRNVQGWNNITTSAKCAGSLLGIIKSGTVFIENSTGSTYINSNVYGDGTHGGIVGLVNDGTSLIIRNCNYDGSLLGTSTHSCGGIIGWRGNSGYARLENVLFEPHEITLQTYRSATFARNASNPLNLILTNCIYTKTFGDIQGIDGIGQYKTDLREKMDWIDEFNACPKYSIEYKKASSHAESKFTNASGTDDFLFEATGKIQPTLQWTPLQLSVLLQWETDDNPVDYFEVQRRTVGGSKEWQTIESGITAKEYEDKTTSPVYDYEYKVLAANNCEGLSFTETEVVTAHCVQTGTVEGYVRFADGTGIPDVLVSVSPSQTHPKDITTVSVRTDDSGYYKVEDLRYYTEQSGPYDISVNIAKENLSPDCADGLGVTFDTKSNIYSNVNFTVTNGYKFSGYVMYYGTSIPVPGVEFTANEHAVQAGGKPITTGPDGKFSFFVLGGETTIQAHKDGHEFYNDGKYTHDFTTNKDKIYFYDKTRVKLIGRVVGGNDQGELPLGNSLSRNNLGQSITINMALEGDNSSWLVFDNLDSSLKERDTVFVHTAHDKKQTYQTSMHTTRHRIEIKPDKYTGEYCVELPPVKWKVQQIFAQGYPTLFQEGKTGDVIDLTDSLTPHRDVFTGKWLSYGGNDVTEVTVEYNAQYSRIYHSPVQIDYKQVGYDKFDYFGDKQYVAKNLGGDKSVVPLAYPDSITGEAVYTFGHPVFSIEKKYLFQLSANEKYYWNNNPKSDTIDVVQMKGGEVVVQNEMVSGNHRETVTLDENGQGTVFIQAAQTPYLLTGEGALRTITMTLELDGVHYEAKPLKAYVLNLYSKQGAKDILNYSVPQLVDILRDPPGGASSAKISRGSTLKYSYQMDMSWKLGLTLNFAVGTKLNNFTGVVAAPMGAGAVGGFNNIAGNDFSTSLDLVWSGSGQRAFSYTMTTTEDISTSTNNKMVGANADLYIGMEQNIIVKPATAIRAIPDSIFRQMGGELKAGRMVEIANGRDINDSIFHLVREEVVTFGPQFKSTFVHSQEYIIKQLIPSLMEQCRALMFTGTREEAQKQADYTGKPVYLSIAKPDSEQFGALYEFIKPVGGDPSQVDEVDLYHKNMLAWVDMIAANEKEKLEATELVQNFDVDGGGGISYGEDFASDYTVTNSFVSPISSSTVGYFDTTAGDIALNIVGVVGPAVAKFLGCLSSKLKAGGTTGATGSGRDESGISHVEVECVGTTFKFGLIPAVSYNVVPKHSESKKFNRKESFTISMDRKSHIDFDVYRVNTIPDYVKSTGVSDVFTNYNFDDLVAYDNDYLKRELDLKDIRYARSFVYRTRGGATCRPWEGERRTVFYEPGTLLDERTKKIENPKIWLDKQSVSGVPFGEAARFTVNMTNESEHPEAAYGFFNLVLDEASNTKGAKLMIDGIPLSGNARTLAVEPSKVTTKTLEVYASEDFDYENLGLTLMSINDLDCFDKVNLSVHYLRTAGPITISTPGDKWIMNTDAQRDSRGYFMPVVISGFDKNQKNFDHVEFQYKETNRGDDYWVNLCSFYANDTLMALASGTKQKIPENGYITTSFYGEGVEMEKAYDLRAVLYCRNGNDYLTSSSKVLSGIKDTRRPQLFNTPEPKDGILGPGDNVTFNFSEAIEHNYLSAITNFEVVGETNETNIQENPSLLFDDKGFAETEARRNYAGKDFTLDMMIKPDDNGKAMPIFSHGSDGVNLQLWVTEDQHLKVIVGDKECLSTKTIKSNGFRHIAMVLNNQERTLELYNDSLIGRFEDVQYNGFGPVVFGATNEVNVNKRQHYSGRMLETRLWSRAMTQGLIYQTYAERQLTGYEMGLADYYPMNEGFGDYAYDKAHGAHAKLNNTSWALPRGMSLHLDYAKKHGLELKGEFLKRPKEADYTLMFWFRTDFNGRGALISNGSGRKTDTHASENFFIGFEGPELKYRSNGMELIIPGDYSDDQWHHYAMTVNRSHNIANIYIDRELRQSFRTDSLGGIGDNDVFLGNMVWYEQGADDANVKREDNAFTGNMDEICLFAQALPPTLIERYSTKSPGGKEKGLITYISFARQEKDENNDIVLVPYVYNQVIKKDKDGKEIQDKDSVFVDPVSTILSFVDTELGAPVQPYQELKNLDFNFVGRDNQLMINLNEFDSRINKRTFYVTVTDIPDMNGNYMASPSTVSFYVDRNPLRWESRTWVDYTWPDENSRFDVRIINTSGASHTYELKGLPAWLSVDKPAGIIEPKSEEVISFKVSDGMNVGTYDEVIYVVDENGLCEPLLLTEYVLGKDYEYEWIVDPALKQHSMNIVGRVLINNTIITDSRDIVGVFDATGRCMGANNVSYNSETAESMVYLTVFDSTSVATPLTFKLWHHQTGRVMVLQPSEKVTFQPGKIVGTIKSPIELSAGNMYIQELSLTQGWNWISLNVYNNDFRNINNLLKYYPWQDGDILTDDSQGLTLIYKNGQWVSNMDDVVSSTMVLPTLTYRIKVKNDINIELTGRSLEQESMRTITVKNGWNSIGYTPMINLDVETALADYSNYASDGDVLKCQDGFSMYTTDLYGTGEWVGSLRYMIPGKGYMLKRQGKETVKFKYNYYDPNSTFFASSQKTPRRVNPHLYPTTMSLAATITGVTPEAGDRLLAVCQGEVRGEADYDGDDVLYMSISGSDNAPLFFVLERGDDWIAATSELLRYESNGVSGSPMQPTEIKFVSLDDQQYGDGWYTLQGVKLDKKPLQRGVYIFNGKKIVVK